MSLRVLIVEKDSGRAEQLSNLLESAHYDVLPLPGLADASEALTMQHFDAVLVPSSASDSELQNFAATLRRSEQNSRSGGHTAILACDDAPSRRTSPSVDALLPYDFGVQVFGATMSKLSERVAHLERRRGDPPKTESLAIFDEAEFREQMCSDAELMVEIIDLYLVESTRQRHEMQAALAEGDLNRLSRLAHTIKGSLGSLHAPRARFYAQELEVASKLPDAPMNAATLAAFEAELGVLEPVLIAFRNS